MINRQELLKDLQRLLRQLEADLRERCQVKEIGAAVKAEYEKAKKANRTAQSFADWRTDYMTQIGAAWILSCVFARFLEDNELVDPPKLSGPGERLQRARDEYDLWVHDHPADTVRDYLLFVFDGLAELPGGRDIFGKHNLVHEQRGWISGDAAKELRNFWQRIDPATGNLIHDFTDPEWDTRFLGDLYQDLSEAARKKYALLQTPEFVEEFILDRTLEPALDEFGLVPHAKAQRREGEESEQSSLCAFAPLRENLFRMIDPACGSGHFLLGAFPRILKRWQKKEPGTNVRELVQRALDSIHGVDINPFAVAIARFRLLLAALKASEVHRLADAPAFHMNLACGDSLYHGRQRQQTLGDWTDEAHYFRTEDADNLRRILQEGTFHAVVANPPYITVNDPAANSAYRRLYREVCHGQYSLSAPFMQRIFRLAVNDGAVGHTGQITANSFMNNEFGKKLVENFFPNVNLSVIVDTRYLQPHGHPTPTVILMGRPNRPISDFVRVVMGIQGEQSPPDDLRDGAVWTSILQYVDQVNASNEYVSVVDMDRETLAIHPWSIGGGGAAELKQRLENYCSRVLSALTEAIGRTTHTGEDPAFFLEVGAERTRGWSDYVVPVATGEDVRDYLITPECVTIFPYDQKNGTPIDDLPVSLMRHYWTCRTVLRRRVDYGQTVEERGLRWIDHTMFFPARYRQPRSIVFAFKVTHKSFRPITP